MWYADSKKDRKTPGLTGLPNLGNTCYMSAALQALFNCPTLTNYFLTCFPYIKLCKKNDLSLSYHHLLAALWENEETSYHVSPQDLLKVMRIHYPQFRGFNQCDPQEFLRCFMDLLHNELKEKVLLKHSMDDISDNEILRGRNSGVIVKNPINIRGGNHSTFSTSHHTGACGPGHGLRNVLDDTSSQSSSMDYETCDSGHGSELEDTPLALRMAILALTPDLSTSPENLVESEDFSSSYNDTSTQNSLPISSKTLSATPSLDGGDEVDQISNVTVTKWRQPAKRIHGKNGKKERSLMINKHRRLTSGRRPFISCGVRPKQLIEGRVHVPVCPTPSESQIDFPSPSAETEVEVEKKTIVGTNRKPPLATAHVAPFQRETPSANQIDQLDTSSSATTTFQNAVFRNRYSNSGHNSTANEGESNGGIKKYSIFRSVISDLFDGVMISTVECLTCHSISKTVEVFQDLSLPIPTSGQISNLRTNKGTSPCGGGPGSFMGAPSSRKLRRLESCNQQQQSALATFITDDGMPPEMGSNQKSLCLQTKPAPTQQNSVMLSSSSSSPNNFLSHRQLGSGVSSITSLTSIASWIIEWIKAFLPFGTPITLQNCLSTFFACDELNGDNMYSCDNCKKLRNGIKESKIVKLPEILCVHLKRFRHDFTHSSKVSTKIDFPLEDLDMGPYLDKMCRDEVRTYDLVGIICHHGGSLASGHYTTYALNYFDGFWYEYDDQCVTRVKEFCVEKAEPYVLFYGKNQDIIVKQREKASQLQSEYNEEVKSHLPFYVSKRWLNKFNYMAEPGPIDHSDFVCNHGAIKPNRFPIVDELCQDVGINTWIYLLKTFRGAGPVNCLKFCRTCEEEEKQRSEKRREEYRIYNEYMKAVQSSDPYQDFETFVLDLAWFKTWEDFIKGHETDPPGRIDNRSLLKVKDGQVTLNHSVPVCHIYENLWKYLISQYGGGPEIPSQTRNRHL